MSSRLIRYWKTSARSRTNCVAVKTKCAKQTKPCQTNVFKSQEIINDEEVENYFEKFKREKKVH